MPWNGSGTFNRIYSWVADKNAGLDISSSRMDTDTDDIVNSGLDNCLTRDGQGQATANLPMAGFKHTGTAAATARTDYSQYGQVQDGVVNWVVATGTADALIATLVPTVTILNDGQLVFVRAASANATTTPTLQVNGTPARTIVKGTGQALVAGDIPGAGQELIFRYKLSTTNWVLLNPTFPARSARSFTNYTVSTSSATLLAGFGLHRVNNTSGGAITLNPYASPASGDNFIIKDVTGNAGTSAITFGGTVDGAASPVIIQTNFGWAELEYNGTNWDRLR